MRKTPALATVAAVTLVAGGATAYSGFNKSVTLTADGETEKVSTFSRTVGDLLADEGVDVGPHDDVVPSPDTKISDGMKVTVRDGHLVSVTVGGETTSAWTAGPTVGEALADLDVSTDDDDRVKPAADTPVRTGLEITVQRVDVRLANKAQTLKPRVVTRETRSLYRGEQKVARAGQSGRRVHVYRETVVDGRVTKRVRVGSRLESAPTERVVYVGTKPRVTTRVKNVTRTVPYKTVRKNSSSLYKGRTKVAQTGRDGRKVLEYRYRYVDGKYRDRTLLGSRTTLQPRDRVVLVGTKSRTTSRASRSTSAYRPAADGLNWSALAQCESSGNPRAVDPSGTYFGLYQFDVGTWRSVGGSGYPHQASASEQTYRAQLLYRQRGSQPWPVCGSRL